MKRFGQHEERLTIASWARPAAVVFAVALVTGCAAGGENGTDEQGGTDEDRGAVIIDALAQARGAALAVYNERSLAEHLPNQRFDYAGTEYSSDYVVLGVVTSAEIVSSYELDGDRAVEVRPGTEAAAWHMAEVTIEVEQLWGDDLPGEPAAVIQVPIRPVAPIDEQLASIESLGRIIAVVDGGRVARNDALLGLVDAAGNITWPILEHPEEREGPEFIAGLDTVEEITSATGEQRATISIGPDGTRS